MNGKEDTMGEVHHAKTKYLFRGLACTELWRASGSNESWQFGGRKADCGVDRFGMRLLGQTGLDSSEPEEEKAEELGDRRCCWVGLGNENPGNENRSSVGLGHGLVEERSDVDEAAESREWVGLIG
jgi:hypothetical protein